MVIYIVSDGKKGHLSQTRGLAAALLKQAADDMISGKLDLINMPEEADYVG